MRKRQKTKSSEEQAMEDELKRLEEARYKAIGDAAKALRETTKKTRKQIEELQSQHGPDGHPKDESSSDTP
jgi:hypothetical protein